VPLQESLQPLPFLNAQRLYQPIGIEEQGKENLAVPYAAIQQWQVAANKSAQIAFTAETPNAVEASSGAERIGNVASSTIFFLHWVCGRLLGRSFLPEETEGAVLADGLHPGEEIVALGARLLQDGQLGSCTVNQHTAL
jgi:hypothetical protein